MSTRPQSLIDVGQLVKSNFPTAAISIRAARSARGFHAGRAEIFGPAGQGARDYSVKAARNSAGLTDASSAIDISRISYKGADSPLRQLTASLVAQSAAGQDGAQLFEVIGPDATGAANYWGVLTGWQPRPAWADGSHRWHVHVSYYRDTEFSDRTAPFRRFFEGYTGPKATARPTGKKRRPIRK